MEVTAWQDNMGGVKKTMETYKIYGRDREGYIYGR